MTYSDSVYIPVDISNFYGCQFMDSNVLRCYHSEPVMNSNVDVSDFYINSNYNVNYSNVLIDYNVNLIDNSRLTNNPSNMNNFNNLIFLICVFCFIFFLVPLLFLSKLFKKRY